MKKKCWLQLIVTVISLYLLMYIGLTFENHNNKFINDYFGIAVFISLFFIGIICILIEHIGDLINKLFNLKYPKK